MRYSLIKKVITAFSLILVLFISTQSAQGMESRKFGIGFAVGTPTGICFKYWLNGVNALNGGISLGSDAAIQLNYLWHDFDAIRSREGRLPVHYGFGAQVQSERNSSRVGLRGVLGLTYIFARAPFDMFFELAPLLEMGDSSGFRLTVSAGARYYF